MKRILSLLFCLLLLATGCNKSVSSANVSSNDETSYVAVSSSQASTYSNIPGSIKTTSEIAVEQESQNSQINAQTRERFEKFINAMIDKNTAVMEKILLASSGLYADWSTIQLKSYTIDSTFLSGLNVTLNISASKVDVFPVGESKWEFYFDSNWGISTFKPLPKRADDTDISIITNAKRFIWVSGITSDFSSPDQIDHAKLTDTIILMAANDRKLLPPLKSGTIPAEYIKKAAKNYFGIEKFKNTAYYNSKTNSYQVAGRGAYNVDLADYKITENQLDTYVDFTLYADPSSLVKAKIIRFTMTKNEDGSYCIRSLKTIQDFGHKFYYFTT